MSLASDIREQLLKSFRAELSEHIRTMTDGLLALEQDQVEGSQRKEMLENTFRAAHSLKGAARAVGTVAIEQLAHALENVLDGVRRNTLAPGRELYSACYQALDAIQVVQASYESGETTPPTEALVALSNLETVYKRTLAAAAVSANTSSTTDPNAGQPKAAQLAPGLAQAAPVQAQTRPIEPLAQPAAQAVNPANTPKGNGGRTGHPAYASSVTPEAPAIDETIRVDVRKLDALMSHLSELLVSKIRLEQRRAQVRGFQDLLANWQRDWLPIRSAYHRLVRQQETGLLSMHRPRSVDTFNPGREQADTRPLARGLSGKAAEAGRLMPRLENVNLNEYRELAELGKDSSQVLRYVASGQERLKDLTLQASELMQQYTSDITHMSLVIDGLEEEIKRLRMLPMTTITAAFGRMVRDLADRAGKEAILTIVGGDTELDKRILEQVKDPLVHLLRNAVDHGIENPETRLAQGKPRFGQVTLSAEQAGKDVVIRISDDGKGLDLEAIRQALARHGRKDPSAMTEAELIDSIFALGMTTSRIITDVSGRGVGMDVVRRNVETLHGRIDVENRPGNGVTFVLTLPLALTGSHGLLVRSAGQLFIAPINTIERTIFVDRSEIFSLEGHDTIQFNGHPVTLVSLSDVLGMPGSRLSEGRITAIILSAAGRRMAFIVDELTGEQEVVIKGLGKQLLRVGGIAGATVMGNGEVVLILNAVDLMKLALRGQKRSLLEKMAKEAAPTQARTSKKILIVDDSITTRTLEKNILEAAGYIVQLAIDGQEALSIVRSGARPDLIVTDIVMPRMDGFELTHQIKSDPQTETLPVILVTSLDSAEDKEHGIEVRADAYIVKSSFDQVNLLETIEQLI